MKLQIDLETLAMMVAKKNNKEIFFGVWSHAELAISAANKYTNVDILSGVNYFAVANKYNGKECSLHFNSADKHKMQMICFRGYIVDGPIHTYSSPQEIFTYWDESLHRKHNGVFSSVMISKEGTELIMVSDLFGISSLYYRNIHGVILFSSDPGLLFKNNDTPDFISWSMRLGIGYIPGDRSLIEDVKRVPAGSILRFTNSPHSPAINRWYEIDKLSSPSTSITARTIDEFDQALSRSMERLSLLKWGEKILPLSSGYDSRLLFNELLKSGELFTTYTVQVAENNGNDVDGVCAENIVKDYSIPHILLDIPNPISFSISDKSRILCVDGMTSSHTWTVPIFDRIKGKPSVLYDGLAGDVLANGNKAWRCNDKGFSPTEKLRFILDLLVTSNSNNYLKKIFSNNNYTISSELSEYYNLVKDGENQSEINYLLWQTRKCTSLWAQQQIDAGKLLLYPYLDLDYIELALSIPASEKKRNLGQRRILQRVSPRLLKYPGTGNLPEKSPFIGNVDKENDVYATQSLIRSCLENKSMRCDLRDVLSKRHYLLLWLSLYSKTVCIRCQWWSKQLCEIVYWWNEILPIYRIEE